MTDTERGLRLAIIAQPECDVARLALADYYDELGHQWAADRAVLIRWQIDNQVAYTRDNNKWKASRTLSVNTPASVFRALNSFLTLPMPESFRVVRGFVYSLEVTLRNATLAMDSLVYEPVEKIYLMDRWPFYISRDHCAWNKTGGFRDTQYERSSLPDCIMQRLAIKHHENYQDAIEDMWQASIGLLHHARQQAGIVVPRGTT